MSLTLARIDFGDLPTWIAVIMAGAAALVALVQLRGQRGDIARQATALERRQAEEIDVTSEPDLEETNMYEVAWKTEAANKSRRPLRTLAARLQVSPHSPLLEPASAGVTNQDGWIPVLQEPAIIPLLRAGEKGRFEFPLVPKKDCQNPRMIIRFTDDASLHWQIDDDMHLQKLNRRNW